MGGSVGGSILAKFLDRKVADKLHDTFDVSGPIGAQIDRYVGMLVVIIHDIVEIIRITRKRIQQQILGNQVTRSWDDFHFCTIFIHDPVHPFDVFR